MGQRLPIIVFALVMAAIPFIPGVPPFWIVLLDNIGLAALVAMGLVLLTGVGGLTSFGQAAFCGFGAYTTAVLTTAGSALVDEDDEDDELELPPDPLGAPELLLLLPHPATTTRHSAASGTARPVLHVRI